MNAANDPRADTAHHAQESALPDPPVAAALYRCRVTHVRTAPKRHLVRHRTYMWLIDLARPPRLPRLLRPLARFRSADHFAGTAPTIREGLERFLAARGVDLAGGRVLMLANARVLGHVFNPLSLYWCHDPQGRLRCVVAEVHNTYGERHCYLLRTDERGRAETAKEFHVSPFLPVEGGYRMRLPLPDRALDLAVHWEHAGSRPFTATVRGERQQPGTAALLRAAVRHPWPTLAVSAAIRAHGVLLWLRGLPVRPRPRHQSQEGVE